MNATDYMKKQNPVWDHLSANQGSLNNAIENACNTGTNFELTGNRFATRSKRLNTNAAKEPIKVENGTKPATMVPSSNRQIRTSGF